MSPAVTSGPSSSSISFRLGRRFDGDSFNVKNNLHNVFTDSWNRIKFVEYTFNIDWVTATWKWLEIATKWVSKCCANHVQVVYPRQTRPASLFSSILLYLVFKLNHLLYSPHKPCNCWWLYTATFSRTKHHYWYRNLHHGCSCQTSLAASARIADSRPEPRTFNSYFNRFKSVFLSSLCSGFWCHLSGKWCRFTRTAVRGATADGQTIALPCTSVIITIVLLNVAWYEQYQIRYSFHTTFTC